MVCYCGLLLLLTTVLTPPSFACRWTVYLGRDEARAEYEQALRSRGLSEDQFRRRLKRSRRWRGSLARPKHREAGVATNLVYAV